MLFGLMLFGLVGLSGCGKTPLEHDPAVATKAIAAVLDDWHEAAAAADEARYFGHFAPDAVFMGTDASERWDVAAFRKYAHPHFAKGKAWSFRAGRRAVMVKGDFGWFDEDLVTPNLGPARGSGVMRHDGQAWRIVHYNLTITVPNERFKEVKALLDHPAQP
jgi:ketosteroid isomerase-like protein